MRSKSLRRFSHSVFSRSRTAAASAISSSLEPVVRLWYRAPAADTPALALLTSASRHPFPDLHRKPEARLPGLQLRHLGGAPGLSGP